MTMRRSRSSIPIRTSTMVVTVAGLRVDGSIGAVVASEVGMAGCEDKEGR